MGCYHYQEYNEITIGKCKGSLNLNEYKDLVALSTEINNSNQNSKKNLQIFNQEINKLNTISHEIPECKLPEGVKLILKITQSNSIKKGTKIELHSKGLLDSPRRVSDGVVYFGKENKNFTNDYILPETELVSDSHFKIKYDIKRKRYKLKNIFGTGTFANIVRKYSLRNNSIINFGTTHLLVSFPYCLSESKADSKNQFRNSMNHNKTDIDYSRKYSKIRLEVIHGFKKKEIFEFNANQKREIKIGRGGKSKDLIFENECISRTQCILFYENNKWFIIDGDGRNKSTNGTWILADDYILIYHKMLFRAGYTTFEARYIN